LSAISEESFNRERIIASKSKTETVATFPSDNFISISLGVNLSKSKSSPTDEGTPFCSSEIEIEM